MVNGTRAIESNLSDHLIEHLNSEIVLETICNLSDAIDWLRSTFFYVRALAKEQQEKAEGGVSSTTTKTTTIEKSLQSEYYCYLGIYCKSSFNSFNS